jgi:hypothetical protein
VAADRSDRNLALIHSFVMAWVRSAGGGESAAFPVPAADVVATLAEIFRHQGQSDAADVLERASAHIEQTDFDNWNGGTYTWALRLEIPVALFATIEPRLSGIEKDISAKLTYFDRSHPNDHLGGTTISPIARGDEVGSQHTTPHERDVRRIWPVDRFRLFLSHVAKHKDELADLGVAAFVAHEDIEPSREWRKEIELALKSMNALAALVTTDFHASAWTDQEIGWALGRGVLVIPVRVGADPYGFAGHIQGVTGALDQPKGLAASLIETLLLNPQTHHEMRRAVVLGFRDARSYVAAQSLRKIIVTISDFTDDEKVVLRNACVENGNVRNAHFVPEAIYKTVGRPPEEQPPAPTGDDDIPF